MAYSIISGRYYYEKNGDYFEFDALIDELDHSQAGSFSEGDIIYDESWLNPSPGFFELTHVTNYSGQPWYDFLFDYQILDVKSYYDSDSGIQLDEISGTGYDNGFSTLGTSTGMEGEVEIEGVILSFDTETELNFSDYMTIVDSPEDADVDGFVDEVTNYQMWTESGGVDLTNRRGRTYSDETSKTWNAENAVQTDSGFSILIKHERKDLKYKIWTTDSDGIVNSMSKWQSGDQMMADGVEDLFDLDLNADSIIGKPPIQDIDDDGFVDGATEYQVFTTDDRVLYLRNKNGRKIFSDDTSRQWDAIKTVATDSSIQTLIEGTSHKYGKFKIWTSDLTSGNLISQTKWLKEDVMTSNGYESLFNYDVNDNGVIGA